MKNRHFHRRSRQLWSTCCDSFSSHRRTKHNRDSSSIVSCIWWCYEWQFCKRMVQKIQGWAHWCAWRSWSRTTLNCDWWTRSKSHKEILFTVFMAPGTTITEVYCETLNNLRRLIQNKRHRMLTKGIILLHINAQPNIVASTNALIKLFN
jgi:hypothetical protein